WDHVHAKSAGILDPLKELLRILGPAQGVGSDAGDSLHLIAVTKVGILAQNLEGPIHGLGKQGAVKVEFLAQAGDLGLFDQGADLTLRSQGGDEKEDRVGADIDGGVVHSCCKCTVRRALTEATETNPDSRNFPCS